MKQHGFTEQGAKRIVRAVRLSESPGYAKRDEKRVRDPRMLYSLEVGIVTASTATGLQDGNGNDVQWEYTVAPAIKGSEGVDGWEDDTDQGTLTGYYFGEVGGLYTTTNVQLFAIPNNCPVVFLRVPVAGSEVVEAWIVGAINDADCA